ncbi:hypothetical protein ANO11243_066510 [Dothideomycetidae sp. 11243]|nr:hypothetical protein ANO11243_066510 [fungal sp. No.11243]
MTQVHMPSALQCQSMIKYPTRHLPASFFARSRAPPQSQAEIIRQAFTTWLATKPTLLPQQDELQAGLPRTFVIYSSLLLFPPGSFTSPIWLPLLLDSSALETFTSTLCTATKSTHVALNAPIPLLSAPGEDNLLRSPTNLVPLRGDFGPSLPPSTTHTPTQSDLDQAYWASARQNELTQIWAPRYTMFSARNVREKTRLMQLASVREAQPCSAVDLFVGVGYFAFSYLAAGVRTVLGWDINPWSIEGCQRGALANRFFFRVGGGAGEGVVGGAVPRLRVWCEDNALAKGRVEALRGHIPPVRHVNAGLLPSSRACWATAVGVLDKTLIGWVHVHENFRVEEIETKADEVRRDMQAIVDKSGEWPSGTSVTVDYVFRVKSYAPGVVHCVLDMRFSPGST